MAEKSYKLRDTVTKRFLSHTATDYRPALFSKKGLTWGKRKTAIERWFNYEAERTQSGEGNPLELIEVETVFTERNVEPTLGFDTVPYGAFRRKQRYEYKLHEIIRNLSVDGFHFEYVIEVVSSSMETIELPETVNGKCFIMNKLDTLTFSGDAKSYMFLPNETELVTFRLSMANFEGEIFIFDREGNSLI